MNSTFKDYCQQKLKDAESNGLLRRLRTCTDQTSRTIRLEGKDLLNFSSNDYLGLSTHPKAIRALQSLTTNVGATASRLISGNHSSYEKLEQEIARFKKNESALVFTSGYAAALGTIPALMGNGDFIVMDKLCHACLVDGARLSGATLRVFPHNHLKRCNELLASCRSKAGSSGKILLITETIFSMDGDLAPLSDLVEMKKKYGAWLMIDEAHATGVLGKNGRGGAEHFGVEREIDISMGTLSKTMGCAGGFICGSNELKNFLVNHARSLIYSTGLPWAVCEAAAEAIRITQQEPELKEKLWKNIQTLGEALKIQVQSPIIPIIVGDEKRCMTLTEKLREKGIFVPAVRYPTVGRSKARLRVSMSAAHTEEDIQQLVKFTSDLKY